MGDLPVYDVVLLPPPGVAARSVGLSEWCAARAPVEFVLSEDRLYPHLSLFMATLDAEGCAQAVRRLEDISGRTAAVELRGTHFAGNEHGMFELFYGKTDAVVGLQEDVLAEIAPLRAGWRRRDPVGRELDSYRRIAPPAAVGNFERYGYDEVGDLFRPHITMTRFQERGHGVDPESLPPVEDFSAVFGKLALCVMGEHGTCTEIVSAHPLSQARTTV
ncbi:MAG: hypothetical protein HOY71_29175 [Nonomuraea sp.]|nr:hypothetical protein [Nonomuraea sp.]